jgi:hypothetical protein
MIEDLANDGAEFVNELLKEVRSIKDEKRWKEVMTPRNKLKLGNFIYNTQTGIMSFNNTSWELEMKATLDQTLQNEIIKNIKDKGAYVEFRKKIANRRNIPETQVDFWLLTLTGRILSDSVGKESTWVSVYPLLQMFLNDVIDGPMEWRITAYLSGITMNVEAIQLEKDVVLRQPKAFDAEKLLGDSFTFTGNMMYFHTVSAVLQIETTQKEQPMISPTANVYALILLLFRTGSVNIVKTFWKGNSLTRALGEMSGGPSLIPFPIEKYTIDKEDEDKLIRFAERIKSKLPIDQKNGMLITDSYTGISIARYQDAILKNEDVINRISYAVMGLEALFLKSVENGELSMRLSQRVSKLINAITGDSIFEIFDAMENAYQIRSNFVHGSIQGKPTSESKLILSKVLSYLRISIVVFLSIENKNKDQIINLIDHSILDHKVDNKLLEMLSNYLEMVH